MTPPGAQRLSLRSRLFAYLVRRSEQHVICGVKVSMLWPSEAERNLLLPKIESALQLIQAYDPARFRYLRRDVDSVWVFGLAGLAAWHREIR